jgi:hypothetical protein
MTTTEHNNPLSLSQPGGIKVFASRNDWLEFFPKLGTFGHMISLHLG